MPYPLHPGSEDRASGTQLRRPVARAGEARRLERHAARVAERGAAGARAGARGAAGARAGARGAARVNVAGRYPGGARVVGRDVGGARVVGRDAGGGRVGWRACGPGLRPEWARGPAAGGSARGWVRVRGSAARALGSPVVPAAGRRAGRGMRGGWRRRGLRSEGAGRWRSGYRSSPPLRCAHPLTPARRLERPAPTGGGRTCRIRRSCGC